MIWMTLIAGALAAPVQFDRVDLLADDPGVWMNDDLQRFSQTPRLASIRFVGQVKAVLSLPKGIYLGASLSSQSLTIERLIAPNLPVYGYAGVQTSLLLPRGAQVGLAIRQGGFRVSAGLSGLSSATWARPDWSVWTLLPTLAVGIGRPHVVSEEPVW